MPDARYRTSHSNYTKVRFLDLPDSWELEEPRPCGPYSEQIKPRELSTSTERRRLSAHRAMRLDTVSATSRRTGNGMDWQLSSRSRRIRSWPHSRISLRDSSFL